MILQNEANAIDVEFIDENGGGLGVRLRHRCHKNLQRPQKAEVEVACPSLRKADLQPRQMGLAP